MTRLQHTRLMMDLGYALGCGKIPDTIGSLIEHYPQATQDRWLDRLAADIQSSDHIARRVAEDDEGDRRGTMERLPQHEME